MIELERTYLATSLPEDLASFSAKHVTDIYLPVQSNHPVIRIRKDGDLLQLTKKQPAAGDMSEMREDTIPLSPKEYAALISIPGKRLDKIRYAYTGGITKFEIDIFQGDLSGLVLIDVEFTSKDEKNAFTLPSFCLVEVTQEKFIAGGMLCGKSYKDIEPELQKFHYLPIIFGSS